jgi:CRP-like cAMP-binding protein
MSEFKAGELVEELGLFRGAPARALVVRLVPHAEVPGFPNRQVVEVQWLATGATSLQFNGELRRVKR